MKIIWTVLLFLSGVTAGGITLPKSFEAEFIQTVTNAKGKVLRYKGSVYFSDHQRLKWSYTDPTKKEVCSNGKEVLVVDHDLEQVSAYRMGKKLDLAHILNQAKPYKEHIYITMYEGKQYTIKLDKNMHLESIAFYDDLDNKVQILFRQVHYRPMFFPVSQMRCNYPAEYDVIRG